MRSLRKPVQILPTRIPFLHHLFPAIPTAQQTGKKTRSSSRIRELLLVMDVTIVLHQIKTIKTSHFSSVLVRVMPNIRIEKSFFDR